MYEYHTNCIFHAKKPLSYSIIILPLHSIVQRWCAHQFYKPIKTVTSPPTSIELENEEAENNYANYP